LTVEQMLLNRLKCNFNC